MKKFRFLFVIAALGVSVGGRAFAHDGSHDVKGLMTGAQFSRLLDTTGLGLFARYWSDYFGGDFSFGFESTSLEAGVADADVTSFNLNASGLVGLPLARAKPHFRLAFSYSDSENDINGFDFSSFSIIPSVAVDFRAADHLLLGLDLLSFPILVDGEIGPTDIDGFSVAFLSGIRLAYIF